MKIPFPVKLWVMLFWIKNCKSINQFSYLGNVTKLKFLQRERATKCSKNNEKTKLALITDIKYICFYYIQCGLVRFFFKNHKPEFLMKFMYRILIFFKVFQIVHYLEQNVRLKGISLSLEILETLHFQTTYVWTDVSFMSLRNESGN
jgi:hypothetical protein